MNWVRTESIILQWMIKVLVAGLTLSRDLEIMRNDPHVYLGRVPGRIELPTPVLAFRVHAVIVSFPSPRLNFFCFHIFPIDLSFCQVLEPGMFSVQLYFPFILMKETCL